MDVFKYPMQHSPHIRTHWLVFKEITSGVG